MAQSIHHLGDEYAETDDADEGGHDHQHPRLRPVARAGRDDRQSTGHDTDHSDDPLPEVHN